MGHLGEQRRLGLIRGNIFAHSRANHSLSLPFSIDAGDNGIGVHNLMIRDNTVYDWDGKSTFWRFSTSVSNVTLQDNDFQNPNPLPGAIRATQSSSRSTRVSQPPQRIRQPLRQPDAESTWFQVGGFGDLQFWRSQIGDTTSSRSQLNYVDPNRTWQHLHGPARGPQPRHLHRPGPVHQVAPAGARHLGRPLCAAQIKPTRAASRPTDTRRCRRSRRSPADPAARSARRHTRRFATQRGSRHWKGHAHLRWTCPEAVGRASVSGPLRLRVLAFREDPPNSQPARLPPPWKGHAHLRGHAPRQSAALPLDRHAATLARDPMDMPPTADDGSTRRLDDKFDSPLAPGEVIGSRARDERCASGRTSRADSRSTTAPFGSDAHASPAGRVTASPTGRSNSPTECIRDHPAERAPRLADQTARAGSRRRTLPARDLARATDGETRAGRRAPRSAHDGWHRRRGHARITTAGPRSAPTCSRLVPRTGSARVRGARPPRSRSARPTATTRRCWLTSTEAGPPCSGHCRTSP